MADTVLYAAVYDKVDSAIADLEALEGMHDKELIGKYDAAVIDKENGKPHIAKRAANPAVRLIPDLVGTGALPRKELNEAATALKANQAELIVMGEPTVGKAFAKAATRAVKTLQQSADTSADKLSNELAEAFKS
ncbi:MAG: hypothetical protein JOZ75_11175 [Candidatus Dormibacteraeota bacterium]|nr:hypothetical protein [Candidatus Dormibacteraeota bacterium]